MILHPKPRQLLVRGVLGAHQGAEKISACNVFLSAERSKWSFSGYTLYYHAFEHLNQRLAQPV